MSIELKVPVVGESITEVVVGDWLKAEGDAVHLDEPIVVLETDKATMEVPSPVEGRLGKILKAAGAKAVIGDVLAILEEGAAATEATAPAAAAKASAKPAPAAPAGPSPAAPAPAPAADPTRVMPAARIEMDRTGVPLSAVTATGPGGRVLKEDVVRAATAMEHQIPTSAPPQAPSAPEPVAAQPAAATSTDPRDEVVPMTLMRRRIAERLVMAQQQAALLTTFNEIDLSTFMDLRKRVQEAFVARHGVKLGLMSMFVKATVDALQRIPQVNAEIRGDAIVYHHYYDIGVAVGGGRGLVVPVLRDADRMSLSAIEKAIADFGKRAQANRLELHELLGGTFTISNGGVYGSLMSTPIVNPPQSGVLGMHAIQDRPVARDGQVVIRPMMYVALTYDHRVVDGREAVTFLKRIKEVLEDPARLILEV
jgi:2-oxoglutarate dehydrogenase E2 component (dihydrolipoamide succinyltransferase)